MKRKNGGFLLVEGSLWSQLLQSKITIPLRNTFLNTSQSSCSILHCSFNIYNLPSLHAPYYKRIWTETYFSLDYYHLAVLGLQKLPNKCWLESCKPNTRSSVYSYIKTGTTIQRDSKKINGCLGWGWGINGQSTEDFSRSEDSLYDVIVMDTWSLYICPKSQKLQRQEWTFT